MKASNLFAATVALLVGLGFARLMNVRQAPEPAAPAVARVTLEPVPPAQTRVTPQPAQDASAVHPVALLEAESDGEFNDAARVAALNRGELTVGNNDLVRIFGLQEHTAPPPLAEVRVEQLAGVSRVATATFDANGHLLDSGNAKRQPAVAAARNRPATSVAAGFQFQNPDGCNAPKKG